MLLQSICIIAIAISASHWYKVKLKEKLNTPNVQK